MPQIDWNKLVSLEYWLEGIAGGAISSTPVNEANSFFFYFWLNLFSWIFIIGIVIRFSQAFLHDKHPFQNKLPFWGNNAIWFGILGLFWFVSRQIEIGFLGSRLWILSFVIWGLVILGLSIRYFIVFFPIEWAYYKKILLDQTK